jgi:hypothetical protein
MDPAVPTAAKRIQQNPAGKLQDMRACNGRDLVPKDGTGFPRLACRLGSHGEILDPLGVQMNLAMIVTRQAFENFRKRPLRPVPAVDERGNDRKPQVSASTDGGYWGMD